MGVECDLCLKTYSSLRNLRRHKQNIHNTQPKVQPFACSDCDFQNTSLVTMKQHFFTKTWTYNSKSLPLLQHSLR